jgi:hypothetical protein
VIGVLCTPPGCVAAKFFLCAEPTSHRKCVHVFTRCAHPRLVRCCLNLSRPTIREPTSKLALIATGTFLGIYSTRRIFADETGLYLEGESSL